jgi:hypothetical protein
MSRASVLLLVLLVVGFAALVLVPHRATAPDVPFAASGVALQTYTEAGDPSWEISAREGEVDGEEAALRDVEVRFRSSDETSLVATADRLVRGENESVFSGHVRVDRSDELHLETEELVWNESLEFLKTSAIELSVRDVTLTGERFEYDLRLDRATIVGNVVATVSTDELQIRAERAEEIDDETIDLAGGVKATFPDGTLSAERARVTETGVVASGDVSLSLHLADEGRPDVP